MTETPGHSSDIREAESLLAGSGSSEFAEPWQAQAFACAIHLSRKGVFTWTEWVEVFSAEIRAHPQTQGETANAAYFRQWLAALERIVGKKGAATSAEIDTRQEAWRQAYLNTPHGVPVELANANAAHPPSGAGHHHHHDHHDDHGAHDGDDHHHTAPKPVAVSRARE